jgi:hypothetical protein
LFLDPVKLCFLASAFSATKKPGWYLVSAPANLSLSAFSGLEIRLDHLVSRRSFWHFLSSANLTRVQTVPGVSLSPKHAPSHPPSGHE